MLFKDKMYRERGKKIEQFERLFLVSMYKHHECGCAGGVECVVEWEAIMDFYK